jgi:Protein of unknown function (DUF4231)
MDQNKFEQYLTQRYEDQIRWYDSRASTNKGRYNVFQWVVIILAAVLPVLIATVPESYQFTSVIVSIILAICTAGLKAFKFQENWINYRTTAETLKKEKHFYDAEINDYAHAADKEGLFVKRIEALISRENTVWESTQTTTEEDGQGGE